MYVCNCNGLSRRAVDGAIAQGATTTSAVFRTLDCSPQCGKCVCEVRALLVSCRHKQQSSNVSAACGECPSLPFLAAAE